MNKTAIEWCESTFNPISGCLHKCEYCYARKRARQFAQREYSTGNLEDGSYRFHEPKGSECEDGNIHDLAEPLRVNGQISGRIAPYAFGFDPTFHRYRLNEYVNKKGRTIFVCSMADLFGEWIPDEWIIDVFKACESAPQHRYLFLTKNPKRYAKIIVPLSPNFWYGSTAAKKGDNICAAENVNSFISIEPLLEDLGCMDLSNIKWVIIGAESGNRKGKVIPKREWIENIVNECRRYGIPVFMKDSLIEIVGEENMLREFPWGKTS